MNTCEMRCVYPGSFDPLTNGHLDVIERAARLFDEVVVAVAENELKNPLFSVEERVGMLREVLTPYPSVSVAGFDGLLVNFVRSVDAQVVVRGLRAVSDFEFEFQMALMNRKLDDGVETIFMMPREEFSYLSSRIIKEIARLGGALEEFVPPVIVQALQTRLQSGSRP